MIRVVLADDHKLFAEGVAGILRSDPEIEVTAVYNNGRSLIQHLQENNADVALVDLNMPQFDGISTIKSIREQKLPVKIIVLSIYAEEKIYKQCKEAGIDGYILKDADPDELIYTIKEVYEGRHLLKFERLKKQTEILNQFSDSYIQKYKLSKREVEIIRLVKQGLTNQEIADQLFLSVFTVDTHRRNFGQKLGVKNTADLVRIAMELQL